jgi:hypothetical protein
VGGGAELRFAGIDLVLEIVRKAWTREDLRAFLDCRRGDRLPPIWVLAAGTGRMLRLTCGFDLRATGGLEPPTFISVVAQRESAWVRADSGAGRITYRDRSGWRHQDSLVQVVDSSASLV